MQLFCLFWYIQSFHHIYSVHSAVAIRRGSSPSPSSLVRSVGKTSLGCRAENRTRARLTASGRTTNWATPHHTELRRTLTELYAAPSLSYAAPSLSYAAPSWFLSRENLFLNWHASTCSSFDVHSSSSCDPIKNFDHRSLRKVLYSIKYLTLGAKTDSCAQYLVFFIRPLSNLQWYMKTSLTNFYSFLMSSKKCADLLVVCLLFVLRSWRRLVEYSAGILEQSMGGLGTE